jgi:hypothetical protein
MFQRPAPRLTPPSSSTLSKSLDQDRSKSSSRALHALDQLKTWNQAVVKPLPPTGQGDGKMLGFFDTAFLLVGGTALSLVGAGVAMSVRYYLSKRR